MKESRIPQSRILSRASFRDLGCLHLLRRLVPFKQPVYEKVVEACSHLAEPRYASLAKRGMPVFGGTKES